MERRPSGRVSTAEAAATAVRGNKAAYDENADRRDRVRAPVKDGSRRLRS